MATAGKLSITLPRDLAEMIRMKVRTGVYASNSEVIGTRSASGRNARQPWRSGANGCAPRSIALWRMPDLPWMPMTLLPASKHAALKNEAPLRPEARQDLHHIGDYIARDDRRAARRFVRMLREKCAFIGRNPHAGRARPEFHEGLRSFSRSELRDFLPRT